MALSPLDARPDCRDLKQRVSCRVIARRYLGEPKRQRRNEDFYFAPTRQERTPSFSVTDAFFKDFGGNGDKGDQLALIQLLGNCDFKQAVDILADFAGHAPLTIVPRTGAPKAERPSGPPSADWQRVNSTLVDTAQRDLFAPGGRQALDYLHKRGLSDETIRDHHLGYDRPRNAIVIPWLITGALWALKFRHLTPGADPKYTQVSGGNQAEALFCADLFTPGKPVIFTEGEFDALLGNQVAGDLATFVTLGSKDGKLNARWLDRVSAAPFIGLALDSDEPGRAAAKRNAPGLPDGHRVLTYPAGKDLTEYALATRTGSSDHSFAYREFRAWVTAALNAPPDPIWRSVPNTWRAGMGEYLPDPAAPLIERLAETGAIVPGGRFSRQQALALGLTRATVDRGLEAGEGIFWERDHSFATYDSLQENTDFSIGKSVIGAFYRVFTLSEITANFLKRAACRIWERSNPATKGQPLGLAKPGFFEALGYSPDESAALATELNSQLSDVYQRQGNAERFNERRAIGDYERLKQSLADPHSTPLPHHWPYQNATEYRAALARGLKEAQPDQNLSLNQWSNTLGIAPRSVPTVLARAGIASVKQFTEREVASAEQAEALGYEIRAYPRRVIASSAGKTIEQDYDPEVIERLATSGYTVVVKYQTANKQTIATEGKPERITRPPATEKPVTAQPKATISAPAPKARPAYFGQGYDPAYVHDWLVQACTVKHGYVLDHDNRLIDMATGEYIADNPTDQQLVDVLRGEPLRMVNTPVEPDDPPVVHDHDDHDRHDPPFTPVWDTGEFDSAALAYPYDALRTLTLERQRAGYHEAIANAHEVTL